MGRDEDLDRAVQVTSNWPGAICLAVMALALAWMVQSMASCDANTEIAKQQVKVEAAKVQAKGE